MKKLILTAAFALSFMTTIAHADTYLIEPVQHHGTMRPNHFFGGYDYSDDEGNRMAVRPNHFFGGYDIYEN
jgi:hypothetical protein